MNQHDVDKWQTAIQIGALQRSIRHTRCSALPKEIIEERVKEYEQKIKYLKGEQ